MRFRIVKTLPFAFAVALTSMLAFGQLVATAPATDAAPPIVSSERTVTKIIAWAEANRLRDAPDGHLASGETYIDRALNGLRFWRTAIDEAIVTTDPRLVELILPEFVSELAPMTIIGGAQTNPALRNRIDNVEGWAEIRDCIEATCRITGHRRFVFDNERALRKLRAGEYTPDWTKVADGLSLLPKDVEYICYPCPWETDRPGDAHFDSFQRMLCDILPNVTLTTFEHVGPSCLGAPRQAELLEYARTAFGSPVCPLVYFEPAPKPTWYWRPDQILEARDTCEAPAMYAYFGVSNFAECARLGPLALRNDMERRLSSARESESEALQRVEAAERHAALLRERADRDEATLATMLIRIAAAKTSVQSIRQRISGADMELTGVYDDLHALFESSTPEVESDDLTPEVGR